MPKFSEKEKKWIEEKLLQEGEQLFTLYGLKTTIDQLAEKSGIAKASFYKFYESKEALYFDILRRSQKEIFLKLEKQLENSKALSPPPTGQRGFCFYVSMDASVSIAGKNRSSYGGNDRQKDFQLPARRTFGAAANGGTFSQRTWHRFHSG